MGILVEFINLVHRYPAWLRGLAVVWIVLTAVIVGALVVMRPSSPDTPQGPETRSEKYPPPASRATQEVQTSPPVVPRTEISAHDYFTRLGSLEERFLQRQEFVNSLAGREVTWEGYVDRVTNSEGEVLLGLTQTRDNQKPYFYVYFPTRFQTQVYSLHKGDLVRVTGVLDTRIPSAPNINKASELKIVNPGSSG
jgi:hypothetical protein